MIDLRLGDCLEVMKELPEASVQTCVTSPPYWGLRDYGVAGQLGLESSPDEYVTKMVEMFRGVRRVLKDNGTLWLNLGDTYSTGNGGDSTYTEKQKSNEGSLSIRRSQLKSLKPKNLVGIPWRVAFALQLDGWYLRQDIIWHKPNPMPESVRDRCTKSHEYIFLLSKSSKYYFDNEAIKEPAKDSSIERSKRPWSGNKERGMPAGKSPHSFKYFGHGSADKRNKRSVWSVTPKPFKGAHFATFPIDLIEPCILAGSREGDTVLDPFNGAGTTGVAALKHSRKYIGIELNPEYIELTKARIEKSS